MKNLNDINKIEELLKNTYSLEKSIPVIDKESIMNRLPNNFAQERNEFQLLESIVWRLVPICCICLVLLHTTDNYLDDIQDKKTNLTLIKTIFEIEANPIFKLS